MSELPSDTEEQPEEQLEEQVPSDAEELMESEEPSVDGEELTEELSEKQLYNRSVKEKVANMYRFTNEMDIRRMPIDTFDKAMSTPSAMRLHLRRKMMTRPTQRKFETNSIVSIHNGDKLVRVVLTESLPFMCTLCGEAFTHTKPLEKHAEEKHRYFQNVVDEGDPRKKQIIIEKNPGRRLDRYKKNARRRTGNKGLSSDSDNDRGPLDVEVDSDVESEGVITQKETSIPDTSIPDPSIPDPSIPDTSIPDPSIPDASITNPSIPDISTGDAATNPEDSVEFILAEMATQGDGTIRKRHIDENVDETNSNEGSVPPEVTADDIPVAPKKQKKQKKPRKRKRRKISGKEKYVIINADHIIPKKKEEEKGKENGEPKKVQVNRPYCAVCHLHCETRVLYLKHLAEAHNIFRTRQDAEDARKKIYEGEKNGEVNGSDEQQDQSASGNVQIDIIQCSFCETFVFDEAALEKHMRIHCGMPGIKCDICREAVRLWENSMMQDMKGLAERFLSQERRPQDVDFGKTTDSVPKYPSATVISTCYECGDLFYLRSHMSNHYSRAHENLTCKECGLTVINMNALFKHSLKEHRPGVFRCQWCPRRFHDQGRYKHHLQGHYGVYRCSGCGRNFLDSAGLRNHIEKHSKYPGHFHGPKTPAQEISVDKPFIRSATNDYRHMEPIITVCYLCNATFVNKATYTRHMNSVHPGHDGIVSNDTKIICEVCGKEYANKASLEIHMKNHDKKFVCTVPGCTRKFGQRSYLRKHLEFHENQATYFCEDCGKIFKHCGSLRFHKRTHTGRKTTCDICRAEFKGRSNLSDHMQEMHNKDLPFTCGECNLEFASRQHLLNHARSHSEVPLDFFCDKCPSAFSEQRHLDTHMRTHNKSFPCHYCAQSFTKITALKAHHLSEHAIHEQAPEVTTISASATVQNFRVEDIDSESVVVVEYPSDDHEAAEAANRAIAALVSELQG